MNAVHDPSSGSHAPASGTDVLADVLGTVRLTGSMLFLVDAATPWTSWAPRTEAFRAVVLPGSQHMVSFHVVTRGRCWAGLRGTPPEPFDTGDVLVIPHGDAYFLANPPDALASYGATDAVAFFHRMAAGELPSVVNEGGQGHQQTQFICGFLGCDVRPYNPVLASLPRMVHLRGTTSASDRMRHLIDFALSEMREPSPAGRSVLLRLAELMFIEVVRRCLVPMAGNHSGWLAGLGDPVVSRALAMLHGAPAARWTLPLLAAQAGTSRSVLAQRFVQFVGRPPGQYLTLWRMQLAARMLAEGEAKIAAVAQAVGYESEAAFSRSFKKCAGSPPVEWRSLRSRKFPAD